MIDDGVRDLIFPQTRAGQDGEGWGMDLGGTITRGRPAGRMTIAGRKVMGYVLRQQAKAEPIIIGEMVRVCGFSCPANAKRTMRRLRELGFLD